MKIIPIIVLSLFLTGCVLFKKPEPPIIPPERVVHIDEGNLQQCALLKENIELSTFDQFILVEYPAVIKQYTDCATKQANSVKLIKELGNIK